MHKVCSIFSQVLKLFPRGDFEQAVKGAQGGTARAGFHQLGPVHGHAVLPVGTGAFVARDLRRPGLLRGTLKHLGVPVAPKRSTLAYANEHRLWELYQTRKLGYSVTLTEINPGAVANASAWPSTRQPDKGVIFNGAVWPLSVTHLVGFSRTENKG